MPYEIAELELAREGVVTVFPYCVVDFVKVPVFIGEHTLFEDEEKIAFSGTVFVESSWSTSLCSFLT